VKTRTRSIVKSRRAVASIVFLAVALLLQSCSAGGATTRRAAAGPRQRGTGPGAPVWRHVVQGWPSNMVADHRGLVVTSSTSVTELDSGGTPRWTSTVEGQEFVDPALSYGQVVVAAVGRLVALNRDDGATRWRVDVPGTIAAIAVVDPLAGRSTVIDSTLDGLLEGRDAADGSIRWQVRDTGFVRARLAFSDDRSIAVALWSGRDHSVLRAFEVASGSVLWAQKIARGASAPVITHSLVVLGAGDGDYRSQALAFTLSDGAPMSTASLPASFEPGIQPGVAGYSVVLVDHFGTVTMVDALHGRLEWQTKLDQPVLIERPVITDGVVVVTTYAREVVWLDRRTGRIIRRWEPGAVPAAIAASDGRLVVALRVTEPGRVEAYPL
jgi:outer membrane protein assembly factor BamB